MLSTTKLLRSLLLGMGLLAVSYFGQKVSLGSISLSGTLTQAWKDLTNHFLVRLEPLRACEGLANDCGSVSIAGPAPGNAVWQYQVLRATIGQGAPGSGCGAQAGG